jgi:hypothetical protein
VNEKTLKHAIAEAERFIRLARQTSVEVVGTRSSGATRRASLDLTRALADMRKPG